MRRWKDYSRAALGVLLSLGFVWLAARGVDWRGAWVTIKTANAALLAVGLVCVVLTAVAKAARWRLMFYPAHRGLRLRSFVGAFLAGQVINAAIPARVGELARALMIGDLESVSRAQAVWTAVVEKVLDTLTLLLFLAGLSLGIAFPAWLQRAAWTMGGAIVVGMVALAVALGQSERATRWIRALADRLPWTKRLRLEHLLQIVTDSVRLLREPRLCVGLVGWSLVAFLISAAGNWATAFALDLELPYTAFLLLLAVLQISAVVPIPTSPGRIGLFHYLCVISLALFGVERDVALVYGVVLHILFYLPMTVGGPFALGRASIDWHTLTRLGTVSEDGDTAGSAAAVDPRFRGNYTGRAAHIR